MRAAREDRQQPTLALEQAAHQLDLEMISSIGCPIPLADEQRAIADFLDRETAKIDTLIEKQERLIELLEEKRQAVITRAVTKGLNPDVRMRDSGVEWLGEVPEHWDVQRLKRVVDAKITDGPQETPEFVDEGVPFLSAESVRDGKLDFERKRGFISRDLHDVYCRKTRPVRGDGLMVKSGATTGNAALVETDEEFSIWSPLALIRTRRSRSSERLHLRSLANAIESRDSAN